MKVFLALLDNRCGRNKTERCTEKASRESPHYKLNTPKFDELPGEDKKDRHSEEINCIALGLEFFFQPKLHFALECTSEFRIRMDNSCKSLC